MLRLKTGFHSQEPIMMLLQQQQQNPRECQGRVANTIHIITKYLNWKEILETFSYKHNGYMYSLINSTFVRMDPRSTFAPAVGPG